MTWKIGVCHFIFFLLVVYFLYVLAIGMDDLGDDDA